MKLPINDFSNGIRSSGKGAKGLWFEQLDNIEIDQNGNLATRPGSRSVLDIGQAVTDMYQMSYNGDVNKLISCGGKKAFADATEIKLGYTLGNELVVNGTFGADSNWTKGANWSIGSGVATCSGSGSGSLVSLADIAITKGYYLLSFGVGNRLPRASGLSVVPTGTPSSVLKNVYNSFQSYTYGFRDGTYSGIYYAAESGNIKITISPLLITGVASDIDIDNVSLKKITFGGGDSVFNSATDTSITCLSSSSDEAIATSTSEYVNPIKIYNSDGTIIARTAGLPPVVFIGDDTGGENLTITPADGGGTNYNYNYYFHFIEKRMVGQSIDSEEVDVGYVHFQQVSTDDPISVSNVVEINLNAFFSIETYYMSSYGILPHIRIYRTENNGTVPRLIGEISANDVLFTDYFADGSLSSNETLFSNGGLLEPYIIPAAKYSTILNSTAYFANGCYLRKNHPTLPTRTVQQELSSNRIWQCLAGEIDYVPATNYLDVDDIITGISNTTSHVIVFTRSKIYRIEGAFDDLGNGGMVAIKIHDSAGCISNRSIVKAGDMLYFAGNNGFYVTNGYQVTRLPQKDDKAIVETFNRIVQQDGILNRKYISGTYDAIRNKVFWTYKKLLYKNVSRTGGSTTMGVDNTYGLTIPTSGQLYFGSSGVDNIIDENSVTISSSAANTTTDRIYFRNNVGADALLVYDISNDCFYTWSGNINIEPSAVYSTVKFDFRYSANVANGDKDLMLMYSSADGHVVEFDNAFFEDQVFGDTNTMIPILETIKTVDIDFGNNNVTKWVNSFSCKLLFSNLSTAGRNMLDFFVRVDGEWAYKKLQSLNIFQYNRRDVYNILMTAPSYFTSKDKVVTRRINSIKPRCKHISLLIQRKDGEIFSNTTTNFDGTNIFGKINVDSALKKITPVGSWGFPRRSKGLRVTINGVTGIVTDGDFVTDTYLILDNVPSGNPQNVAWSMSGIPAGQRLILNNIEFDFIPYENSGTNYDKKAESTSE